MHFFPVDDRYDSGGVSLKGSPVAAHNATEIRARNALADHLFFVATMVPVLLG